MSEPLSTETDLGEGFAFFRWHSLKWPLPCTCTYTFEQNFCAHLWRTDRGA